MPCFWKTSIAQKKGLEDACQASLNTVLDYNGKSLAPFDGIDIYVKPSARRKL